MKCAITNEQIFKFCGDSLNGYSLKVNLPVSVALLALVYVVQRCTQGRKKVEIRTRVPSPNAFLAVSFLWVNKSKIQVTKIWQTPRPATTTLIASNGGSFIHTIQGVNIPNFCTTPQLPLPIAHSHRGC